MQLTIIVPTFNEAPNVAELVRRTAQALRGVDAEMLFMDDSTDDTPEIVRETAATAGMPVRVIHRDHPVGGLGGAVIEGLAAARADLCVVMDGDLQHPPSVIPDLLRRYERGDVDLVVASRYRDEGSHDGLAGRRRVLVSKLSTLLTKAMFPIRLKEVSDPMTGFFLVDRRALDPSVLQPRGYKILLEILVRTVLRVAEVPFVFAHRLGGRSKATLKQGLRFLWQLTHLRFGKMSLFAVIGALGAVANVAIVWLLTRLGVGDLVAVIAAAEATIVGNFLLIDRFVFQDLRAATSGAWQRFAKSFAFNNVEMLIRLPLVGLMIGTGHITVVLATGFSLVAAFVVRFVFHALVVYAPRRTRTRTGRRLAELDDLVVAPGEL